MMKNIVYWAIFVVVIGSSLLNIYRQATNLWQAKKDNQALENKIAKLENEISDMTRELEYATSSAFLEEQAREQFGLGTGEDYWLKLPPEKKIDLYPEMEVVESKSNIEMWRDWLVGMPGVGPGTSDL